MNPDTAWTAVVYWPGAPIDARVVTAVRPIAHGDRFTIGTKSFIAHLGPAWWCRFSAPIQTKQGVLTELPVYDCYLRPIGQPADHGIDEMEFLHPLTAYERTEMVNRDIARANEANKFKGSQS